MAASANYQDLVTKYELECPVCFNVYTAEGDSAPALLECVHSVCKQCFAGLRSHPNCPECRKPFTVTDRVVTNPAKVTALELVQQLCRTAPPEGVSAASSSSSAAPEKPTAPAGYTGSLSCTSIQGKLDAHAQAVQGAFESIIPCMGWENITHALFDEFQTAPQDWVCLRDTEDQEVKGIAWLQALGSHRFACHWAGVNDQAYARSLFKAVMKLVCERSAHYETQVSFNFFIDREFEKFREHLAYAIESGCQFDVQSTDTAHLKARRTLALYPFSKIAEAAEEVEDAPKTELESTFMLRAEFEMEQQQVKKNATFEALLKLTSTQMHSVDPFRFTRDTLDRFARTPDRFFIYTINDKAAGYFELSPASTRDRAVVATHGIHPNHAGAERHCILAFLQWLADTDRAYTVRYTSDWRASDTFHEKLRDVAKSIGHTFFVDMSGDKKLTDVSLIR